MSRIHIYALSLCVIAFTAACTSAPESSGGRGTPAPAGGEDLDAPEGPKPEPTLERPGEPTLKPVETVLAQPEPFRFDARKKVALQKRKPENPVRRPPTDTLPEPPGRQAPLSLTSSQLHHPLPPPKAPEITPVIPEDPRASSEATPGSPARERQAAAGPRVAARGYPETPSDRRGTEMSPAATAPGTAAAAAPASGRAPAASTAPASGRAPAQARASSDSGRTAEAAGEASGTERQRREPPEPAQGTAAPESPGPADASGRSGTPDDGPGESYPYELVESSDRRESVVGEELTVRLPGDGWLYLGESGRSEEVRFITQRESNGETIFRFRINRSGEYELQFQRQELFSGRVSEHRLEVAARSSGEEESEAEGLRGEAPRGIAADSGIGGENPPEVPGASSTAAPLRWPEEFSTEALLQNPTETLRRARESEAYDALSLAELVARRGDARGAISLLEAYQGQEDRELELDELWFRMAGLLEREEEARDLRRAVELYERVVDEYPLSVYYEPSRQRVEYLKRHFFLVR